MKNLLIVLLISISGYVIAQNPVADFNYTDVCLGSSTNFVDLTVNSPTTWDWDFGDGGVSTQQNPVYTYSNPGSYPVELVVYNGVGFDTIVKVVTVFPNPTVNAGADQTICLGTAANLNATGGITYNWSPGTGLSSPTVANPSASPTTTTTYTVTVTDVNGCMANDMVNVMVNPLPNINTGPDQFICSGDGFTPMASGGVSYIWDNGATNGSPVYPSVNTSYTVIGTDINGCVNSASLFVTVSPAIFLTDNVTNVSCNGGTDGTINISPTGGQAPYTYLWSTIGATTPFVSGITAGNYTVTVTDANGCTNMLNSTVTEPTPIFINFTTVTNASCFGANDGFINTVPNGGTPPYYYNWSTGATTQNINGLDSGTYNLTVTDANGCTAFDMATINEPLPNSIINGTIYYQTVPVTAGIAELIRQDGALPEDMTVVDITAINPVDGVFRFDEVEAGNYIIKVLGDTSIYNCAATYSVSTTQWQLAQDYAITSSCNDSLYLDIDLIELPNNSGPGTINGRLVTSGGSLLKAPGDPIPDIDITVEQSPGGGIMSATTTDIDGYFTINNLPLGTYLIKADMLGYGMDTLQTITFNGTDNSYNVTLCSDDTINMVDMCNMTITSVKNVITTGLLNIYPNPASNEVTIRYNGNTAIKIEVTDITGKNVLTDTMNNNIKTLDISNFNQGVYFIQLSNQETNYIHKLIVR